MSVRRRSPEPCPSGALHDRQRTPPEPETCGRGSSACPSPPCRYTFRGPHGGCPDGRPCNPALDLERQGGAPAFSLSRLAAERGPWAGRGRYPQPESAGTLRSESEVRGPLRFLPQLEMRPSSNAPNPVECREAPPTSSFPDFSEPP